MSFVVRVGFRFHLKADRLWQQLLDTGLRIDHNTFNKWWAGLPLPPEHVVTDSPLPPEPETPEGAMNPTEQTRRSAESQSSDRGAENGRVQTMNLHHRGAPRVHL